MAKYYFNKYNVVTKYIENSIYSSVTGNDYWSGYPSYKLNSSTGQFTTSGTLVNNTRDNVVNSTVYNVINGNILESFTMQINGELYYSKNEAKEIRSQGSFIETIVAEKDAYPTVGIKNGYYYNRSYLAEKATMLSPNGGEIIMGNCNITWSVTNANLPTRLELSTDNGNNWRTLANVGAGVFNYLYDFNNEISSSTALLSVRMVDSTTGINGLSTRDPSDAVFTIYHNVPPTAPTLTYPNGGEVVVGANNITWILGTDTENHNLQTEISYSHDNGATWQVIALTDTNATNYLQDFTHLTESAMALIKIRHYDGYNYGNYDTSGIFTVNHNVAPSLPTNLSPANGKVINKTEIQRLAWKHNDNDAQSKFDLQWSSDGGQTWTTITKVSTNQYNDFGANVFPDGVITWRVRTYDQGGLVSSYSNQAMFTSAAPSSAPVITSPDIVTVARPTIEWSSIDQAGYQTTVYDTLNTLVWDSGEIVSGNKAITVGVDLINLSTYTVKVKIKNSMGLWSNEATQVVSISYTPPQIPLITLLTNTARATIIINIVNPTGVTAITHNDIFRDGQRIATGIIGVFTDYTVESEKEYSYRVRAWGENGTYADSDVVTASVMVKHTQLALTTNYNKWIELKWNPEKSDNRQHNAVSNYFAGRKFSVTDFSENENNSIPNSFAIRDKAELDKLIEIYDAKQTVIYRDRRGKRLFGTLNNLSIADESPRTWWTVSFTLQQVDFDEVI